MIKNIDFINEIENPFNDNIDIIADIEDSYIYSYTYVISTALNYYWYMNNEQRQYVEAHPPDIIVRKLSKQIIKKLMSLLAEDDGYWLKVYALAGDNYGAFDFDVIDKPVNKDFSFLPDFKFYKKERFDEFIMYYPDNIEDITNCEIYIKIKLNNENEYVLKVTTPSFLFEKMNELNLDYTLDMYPKVIVEKVTLDILKDVIDTYLEYNAYWLKFYNYARFYKFDINIMDEHLKARNLDSLASDYYCENNKELAIKYYNEALNLYEKLNDQSSVSFIKKYLSKIQSP